jgi:hypothetical protein
MMLSMMYVLAGADPCSTAGGLFVLAFLFGVGGILKK